MILNKDDLRNGSQVCTGGGRSALVSNNQHLSLENNILGCYLTGTNSNYVGVADQI